MAETAHPDCFLFTNNDIRLASGAAVEAPLRCFREHPEVGAVGPEIIGPDGHRQSPEPYEKLWTRYVWKYLSTPFLSKNRKRKLFRLDYPDKALEGYHYRLMGSFMLVDAEAFFQAGQFDEATFLYGEEFILSDRLLKIGKKCWFCPSGTVYHEHGAIVSSHFSRTQARLMDFDSMSYFYRTYRNYRWISVLLARLLYRVILFMK